MKTHFSRMVMILLLVWFLFFFVYPIGRVLWGGFTDEGGHFTSGFLWEVFRNPIYLEGLFNSLKIAASCTLLCALISIPLAILSVRFVFPGKRLLSASVLIPMILPPFVGAIGFKQFWGQAGVLNAILVAMGILDQPVDWLGISQFWGVVIAMALHLYPVFYLNAAAAIANIDPSLEEAARNLGSSSWLRFRRITLPLAGPGIFAGGTVVFIWAFTELGTPLMFDYQRVASVQIFDSLKEIGDNPFPYVLVGVVLVFSVMLYVIGKYLLGRSGGAMLSRGTVIAREVSLSGWRACTASMAFLMVVVVALIPHLMLILVSVSKDWYETILPSQILFSHYQEALGHPLTVPSIQNSLWYAGIATLADLVLGFLAAWVIVRSNLRGRALLDALCMAPLAVPGIVLAFGYLAMTQPGEWFSFLDPTRDPTALLVIAYSMRRLPYVVRSVAAGLEQTSQTLEEAAHNLGAGLFCTLRRITLPLVSANLIAGAILAFCFAMLEVSDSLMLAQKMVDYPITKAIYELFGLLGNGKYLASALGVWSMAFLGVGLLLASLLLGRKLGNLFRV